MRRVDKALRRTAFDDYTKKFIANRLRVSPDVRFENPKEFKKFSRFKNKYANNINPPYNNGWLQILMEETESRCCYCMARIASQEVSVEHLVPKSFHGLVESDEMAFYEQCVPDLSVHLMTGREFDNSLAAGHVNLPSHMRMPHIVAHINLFPSCVSNAVCHCNSVRHNLRILPMMLMPDVETWTSYSEDGSFVLTHTDVEASAHTLEHLDLNSHTLKVIRQLWYLFSRKGLRPTEADGVELPMRDTIIRQALDIDATALVPDEFTIFIQEDPLYWNHMLKYDWFFDFYLARYPVLP